ncbi:hypothetical protein BD413DRAFT_211019 [Trametes elegans]|nr:hypothetical protein BD413DRAFT_211019 [Trametes elegans]
MESTGHGVAGPPISPGSFAAPYPDRLFQGILVATLAALLLFGVFLHQLNRYYSLYERESLIVQTLVVSVLFLQVFHVIVCMHTSYSYVVSQFFSPYARAMGSSFAKLIPVSSAALIFLVQSFFIARVYLLGVRYQLFAIISAAASLLGFGFSISVTVLGFSLASLLDFTKHRWLIPSTSVAVLVSSVTNATVLLSSLRDTRAGMARAPTIVDKIILYGLTTGLLPSLICIAAFILSFGSRHTLQYFSAVIVLAALHVNALLAALNSRPPRNGCGHIGASERTLFGTVSNSKKATAQVGTPSAHHSTSVIGNRVGVTQDITAAIDDTTSRPIAQDFHSGGEEKPCEL